MHAETNSSRVRGCLHSHLWLDGHSELDHLFPFRTQKLSSSALGLVLSCASRRETPSLSTTPFLASRSRIVAQDAFSAIVPFFFPTDWGPAPRLHLPLRERSPNGGFPLLSPRQPAPDVRPLSS